MGKQRSGTAVRLAATAGICVLAGMISGGACQRETTVGLSENPIPSISSLAPPAAQMGGSDFRLTVNGSGFVGGSRVRWNGSDLTTSFLSSNELEALVSASDIAAAGAAEITVHNPAPGGGTSSPQMFNVENPVPSISTLTPPNATAGGDGFTLTVDGEGFVQGSTVRWNDSTRATTYVNGTRLTAEIGAADIASGDSALVTVLNPGPGGGPSDPKTFIIQNDPPTLTSLSPDTATAGGGDFTLTVYGAEFVTGSVVRWDGADRPSTFVSDSQITASIAAADIADGGTVAVTVYSPPPGGGESTPLTFTVNNPAPSATSMSPTSAVAGGADFTLTVDGSNFVPGSVVRWDGADRATTFVNSGQLTATILASDIAATGTAQVTVFNPTPGGGESSALTFNVDNPVPNISSLSPSEEAPGSPAFTLTVNGDGFVSGSVVRWDGADRTTTFINNTQLTASIAAADVATPDTVPVTVFNPTPGGGESAPVDFYVQNPTPVLISITPNIETVSAPGFTLTLYGSEFISGSVVRWNGADRATTFVADTQLTATIPDSDLSTEGTVQVTVFNPAPGGGESDWEAFVVQAPQIISAKQVNLLTNSLIYDSTRAVIYASVPSAAGGTGNSIAIIDPLNAVVDGYIPVGSEPDPLAISDDGQYLYVGLDGAAAIARVVLASATVDTTFTLGSDPFFGPYYAEDMEVLPGAPASVAVSLKYSGVSPRHAGVAVYDDGVMRATQTGDTVQINRIEFGTSSSRLYGYNNETSEWGFRRLTVNASGVFIDDVTLGLIDRYNVDIRYSGGRVYASSGEIIEPEAGTLQGTFSVYPWGLMVPDSANDRVLFLEDFNSVLQAYDMSTYTMIGEHDMTLYFPASLIRWGQDGIAFSNNDGTTVSLIRSTLVKP